MNIYIDEAGVFVKPKTNKCAISAIGALILTEKDTEEIFTKFNEIKTSWGCADTEIKGSSLNESQVSTVIEMLSNYSIIFEVIAIDMNIQKEEDITALKMDRAKKMTDIITDEFNPTLIKNLQKMKNEIENLSNQLYTQLHLTIELLINVLQKSTLYYSLREAKELEYFNWVIDAKNENMTTSEKLWSTLILPLAQSKSLKKPLITIKEGNYDYFYKSRNIDEIPEYLKNYCSAKSPSEFSELKSIFNKNMSFEDSGNNLGLQLSDILTTSIRRGMNGNLQIEGLKNLNKIMVQFQTKAISFMSITENCDYSVYQEAPPYYDLIAHINKTAKDIFLSKEEMEKLNARNM